MNKYNNNYKIGIYPNQQIYVKYQSKKYEVMR